MQGTEARLVPIDLEEMLGEVRRELNQRQQVYPRLIQHGRLNARMAARQIDRMQAVLEVLLDLRSNPQVLPNLLRQRQ